MKRQNISNMNTVYRLAVMVLVVALASCGAGSKEKKGDLNDKKVQLQEMKNQQDKLAGDIKKLEEEIVKIDPDAAPVTARLVSITPLAPQDFEHFIDLQGRISTDNIYAVTPRGGPAQVKAIYVKEGDAVRKGQLLLKLDDGLLHQQIEQAKINLSYAKDLYQRRKNLWDQNIGTEVELITARNSVANQEKQLSLLNEQLSYSNIYSEVSGVAESVNIRVGETFTGSPAMGITIVNPGSLKAVVSVPENYLSRVRKGLPVVVEVPDINKKFQSTISLISTLIDPNSRGFTAEAKVSSRDVKPNQMAIVKIRDYAVKNVMVVPISTIQTDEKGKFVFLMAVEKGNKIARKRAVSVGEIYGEHIEIKQGLAAGEQLITEGYQGLYEGQVLTTEAK
ncbi:MAG: efflux RND transporter periplasmic adaptor subunit [Chitinophagaceae bacterium]